MLSTFCIFAFIFQLFVAVVVGSASEEDSKTVTKGTMLHQSSMRVFSGATPHQIDDFDSLVDEFDSDTNSGVYATGAEASNVQDIVYETGLKALPAMFQEAQILQSTAKNAWYKSVVSMVSTSRLCALLPDLFLVLIGVVGYCVLIGRPSLKLSENKVPNRGAVDTNRRTDAMKLETDAIVQAMQSDKKEHLQELLREMAPDASDEVWGCTALHAAAQCDNAQAAEALLIRGANANVKDAWDETPLHLVARNGGKQVCELLIAYGAELNAMNAQDCTPLVVAAHAGQEAVCKLLLSHGAGVGGLAENEVPPLLLSLIACNIFTSHDASKSAAN